MVRLWNPACIRSPTNDADAGHRIGKGVVEFARTEDIVILRTVNGRKMAGLYNISAIRNGAYDDPAVYANDVIVVGDSPQRRLFRDFVSLSPILAAPLLAILQ
jgi:polysaccharide export outer membrane protein